jgi:NADH:ubiquinone oxidoreductase subunit 2 (subunit N)
MAPEVNGTLAFAVVALPFLASGALALIASWRVGGWINAACATVLFILSCGLPWDARGNLVRLTTFIAMTTSWYAARDADEPPRLHRIACPALVGAILLALLAAQPILIWAALVIAVVAATAIVDTTPVAPRLLLSCGAGLVLALLGTLLLDLAPMPATLFLVLGYGGVAGLAPLHAWLVDTAAEAPSPGALLVSVLLPIAPLLIFMRLQTEAAPALLVALGLFSLLCGGALLFARPDPRQAVALYGVAQLGLIECGIALGISATPRMIAMLALARAALLQCRDGGPTYYAALLAAAVLPLFALYLLAEPAAAWSGWLLLPLGLGALLTTSALPRAVKAPTARSRLILLTPIWLEVALVVVLAVVE